MNQNRPHLLQIFALCLISIYLSSCSSARKERMIIYYGEPWAQASINQVDGIFLVDTGASVTVIDQSVAGKAQLMALQQEEVRATTGMALLDIGWAKELQFAGKRHENRLVSVKDLSLFRAPGGRKQAGLIGSDFLSDYTVVFELPEGEISLRDKRSPIGRKLVPYAMYMRNGIPTVQIEFNDLRDVAWAHLDTGSGYSDERYVYLDVSEAVGYRMLGGRLDLPPDDIAPVISVAGEYDLPIYHYGPIKIMGKQFDEVRIVVHRHGEGLFSDENAILISGSVLLHFDRVEIDYPARSIWVREREL